MLYIPKIGEYFKTLTDDEVKDFVVINFGKYFKFTTEKLYSKLSEEQNLRKIVGSLYILITRHDKVEKYADNCIYHYNVMILNLLDPEL